MPGEEVLLSSVPLSLPVERGAGTGELRIVVEGFDPIDDGYVSRGEECSGGSGTPKFDGSIPANRLVPQPSTRVANFRSALADRKLA
jgi:hypothetical protein